MFSKLRYAARVLSASESNRFEEPDITFVEEKAPQVSKVSRVISVFVEIMVVSALISTVLSVFANHIPFHTDLKITGVAGAVVVLLTLLFQQLMTNLHNRVGQQLKIGEKVAPFFGRRITRVVQLLSS